MIPLQSHMNPSSKHKTKASCAKKIKLIAQNKMQTKIK
jgi:hypothetical protein